MIIEDLKIGCMKPGPLAELRPILFRAKHFKLGPEAAAFVKQTIEQAGPMLDRFVEFAIPPFDYMAITIEHAPYDIFPAGLETCHVWAKGRYRFMIRDHATGRDGPIPGWNHVDPETGRLRNPDIEKRTDEPTAMDKLEIDHKMLLAVFLLLAQPKAYQVHMTEPRRVLYKGKQVRFMATSEITINLRSPKRLVRLFATGCRSAPRRHEVRRHWVHFRGDRSHEHVWLKTSEPGEPARYECGCGMLRRERGPFERGDAGRGFVQQHYKLVA